MAMVVVHPAYWNRGHGTMLVKWATQLNDIDKVKQSVSAAGMGKKLYTRLKFQEICRITADGDEDDPEGVFTDLLEYRPVLLLDWRQLDWSWIYPSLLRTGSEAALDWIRGV
jgi:GNAT superfamily N-acetyltransferase